ncbi:hypothetical protein [Hymenobacter jeollabukensis]|uniref:Uncharacterized protein n=1 Tax=Hymenobacter jeollabukensis TaxID=2025313 RepID=A0A5R8WP38_9BACT|nr:hypothetical protein [Hymenobacter jeollabukensis]TLM91815.1 hypothetical protein FDY95_14755 [Hymenobacter jeollabukensis]
MNRASLLHILDHASGISEAEVRELEQLAAAFPYCQTAHLLLAKAAHDRGSMLAGQRLRRAATYAADRELLRALIEQPAADRLAVSAEAVAAPYSPAAPVAETVAVRAADQASSTDSLVAAEEPEVSEVTAPAADQTATAATAAPPDALVAAPDAGSARVPAPDSAHSAAETSAVGADSAAEEQLADEAAIAASAEASSDIPVATTEEEVFDAEAAAAAGASKTAEELADIEPIDVEPTDVAPADTPVKPTADSPGTELTAAEAEPVSTDTAPEVITTAEPEVAPAAPETDLTMPGAAAEAVPAPLVAQLAAADELPLAAPPIRPPVEAGSSRFEFGLGDAPEPDPAYLLPEIPEAPAPGTIPPYRADELLAYALSSGSRFGAALTLRVAELTQDLPTAATWHPDAALQAHAAAHRPAPPALPSSLALIDKFLRSQPRIKTAQRPAPTDSPQADLSVRSTSAAPSLASESLAKIMVRQGKIGRAIEIYEQLMQRQPEKKAYFAAQIDLLNQQPE